MSPVAAAAGGAPRPRRARPSVAPGDEIKRAEDILRVDPGKRARMLETMTPLECAQLFHDWSFWARPDQAPPPGDWIIWLILAGRGAGKTRAGAEAVRNWVESYPIVNLIGATVADVRDTMVRGESGILACCRPDERPRFLAADLRLEWPNGAVSWLFSAEEPDRLRGRQHYKLWCDELAAWRQPDAFDQALLGLRLGHKPQAVVTTTPRPTKIIKKLTADKDTIVTRGSTFDNKAHLARAFLERITARYKGRTIGRQELFAEIVEETPGALWTRALIERQRVEPAAAPREFAEIVVAVDPPARSGAKSDECGIIVAARAESGVFYVLADLTSQGDTPGAWGARVGAAYRGLSRLQGEPRRRRDQQRRRHGRRGPAPERASPAGARGHSEPRQIPARRAGRGGLRARPRLSRRRVRQARGPALRADPGFRSPRRRLLARPGGRARLGAGRSTGARPAGGGRDAGVLGGKGGRVKTT
jgi:phage terminase large subunit-like protein